MNRNAEPVVYVEPPADEGYIAGDREYYNTKRKAPMSDDENDEDYGGKSLSPTLARAYSGALTFACSNYEEEKDQVDGGRGVRRQEMMYSLM